MLPVSRLPNQMPNCTARGRSSPRPARICATCSGLAASPAMITAGSPGVSRSIRNTSTATISRTGMVAARRLARKVNNERLLFLDVPVEVARPGHEAGDAFPNRGRIDVLPERGMGADLESARLDRFGHALFLGLIGGARKLVAQFLQLFVAAPAEPALVAQAVDRGVGERIPDVGRNPGGAENVPAALRRQILFRAARYHGVPVHRLQVHF